MTVTPIFIEIESSITELPWPQIYGHGPQGKEGRRITQPACEESVGEGFCCHGYSADPSFWSLQHQFHKASPRQNKANALHTYVLNTSHCLKNNKIILDDRITNNNNDLEIITTKANDLKTLSWAKLCRILWCFENSSITWSGIYD